MTKPAFRGNLPFSEPLNHPDARRDWHSTDTEWVWFNYFHAFGYLMHSYSRMEANLNVSISSYVKKQFHEKWPSFTDLEKSESYARKVIKNDEILQALTVPLRPAPAKDTLKRLLRITDASKGVKDRVDAILAHFSAIGKFRDMLAHNAPDHDCTNKNQIFILRNSFLVNDKSKEVEFRFPIELLMRAAYDLANMPNFLFEILNPFDYDDPMINPGGGRLPSFWDEYGPWRCKPSELAPLQKASKSNHQKGPPKIGQRQRRPQPSPE